MPFTYKWWHSYTYIMSEREVILEGEGSLSSDKQELMTKVSPIFLQKEKIASLQALVPAWSQLYSEVYRRFLILASAKFYLLITWCFLVHDSLYHKFK